MGPCSPSQMYSNFKTFTLVPESEHYWYLGLDNLYCGACTVYCRMSSRISGLHPLNASSTSPTLCPIGRHCQMPLGAKSPRLRRNDLESTLALKQWPREHTCPALSSALAFLILQSWAPITLRKPLLTQAPERTLLISPTTASPSL